MSTKYLQEFRVTKNPRFNGILTCFVLQNDNALFVDAEHVVDDVLGVQELVVQNAVQRLEAQDAL